jgi:hypothetical protein
VKTVLKATFVISVLSSSSLGCGGDPCQEWNDLELACCYRITDPGIQQECIVTRQDHAGNPDDTCQAQVDAYICNAR